MIQLYDADWYGLAVDCNARAITEEAADWIETQTKMAAFHTADWQAPDSGQTVDIGAVLARHPEVSHIKIEDGKGRPLGRSFRVKLWPTLVLIDKGKEVGRVVRPNDEGEIEAIFSGVKP